MAPVNKVNAGKKTCSRKCGWILSPPPHKIIPVEQRFWSKVDKSGPIIRPDLGPCWLWTGATDDHGYGKFREHGKAVKASRVAMRLSGMPLDDAKEACHKCDNPPCVNPEHIFSGTHLDNMLDMHAKGRREYEHKTHCIHGHEYAVTGKYRGGCLACRRSRRAANLESAREYEVKYRKKNKEKLREYMRLYHKNRKEKEVA
jgi:hypothetical protein